MSRGEVAIRLRYLFAGVVITILASVLFGCSETTLKHKSVPAAQIAVDFQAIFRKSVNAIMEARYDDAVRLFQAVENHTKDLGPKSKAAYLIQRAQAEAMLFNGHEAIQHLTEADSITRKHNLDSLRCLMYNAYGILAQNAESDRYGALEYYIQGINLAKEIKYDYMRAVLSANAAWLFLLDRDMSGLVYAEWCYNYAVEHNVPNAIYCGALTTAQFYIQQNRLVEAETMLNIAKEAAIKCNTADLTELYMSYGDLYVAKEEYPEACDNFKTAISYSDIAMVDYTFFAYVHYAELLVAMGEYRNAVNEMKVGLQFVEHHHMQVERPRAYNVIAYAYERIGKSDSASYYKTRAVIESDILHRRDISNVKRNLISKYEHEHSLAIAEMELRSMRERFWLYILAFIFILTALVVSIISRYRVVRLYKQLVTREVEWNKEKSRLTIQHSINEVSNDVNEVETLCSDNERLLFERIDKLMRNNELYKDPYLGRDKLAELLETNRTYISKAINSVRGESVSRYIAIYRLEAASKLLTDINNNTPIKDIATELGFTSLSTFYSLFKERYEMSPDKFRKYARKEGGEKS